MWINLLIIPMLDCCVGEIFRVLTFKWAIICIFEFFTPKVSLVPLMVFQGPITLRVFFSGEKFLIFVLSFSWGADWYVLHFSSSDPIYWSDPSLNSYNCVNFCSYFFSFLVLLIQLLKVVYKHLILLQNMRFKIVLIN